MRQIGESFQDRGVSELERSRKGKRVAEEEREIRRKFGMIHRDLLSSSKVS
jgi:hypothetical protein